MLLKGATLLTFSPPQIKRADLRVMNGIITAQAKTLTPLNREKVADLSGKYIMPGMVNAHTHLYSALARGMSSPKQSPKKFLKILKKIWWRLDESLDDESIYCSALVGSIDALKYGTTLLFDHHASPNYITGSLDLIKQAMSDVGLRGVLCYETTDRGGRVRRDKGLSENERFVSKNLGNPFCRGTIGAHASFTLNDDTMHALGEMAHAFACGVHIHVAEDLADVRDAKTHRRVDIVKRLNQFGILKRKSILAHGVHLSKQHLSVIEQSGAWLVHNPRSNMNNAVGYAPLRSFPKNAALGTDGFPADMFEEIKYGFFRNQESEQRLPFSGLPEMLSGGHRMASSFFGKSFGKIDAGAPADLVVIDYATPTPLGANNLLGHLLFGMNSGMLCHTMVNGEWVVFDRRLVCLDEEEVMRSATKAAKKLWQRMQRS